MPSAEPEVVARRRYRRGQSLGRVAGRAYRGGMTRVLKYALVGLVLSVLLTPVLGIGITVVAAILRRNHAS